MSDEQVAHGREEAQEGLRGDPGGARPIKTQHHLGAPFLCCHLSQKSHHPGTRHGKKRLTHGGEWLRGQGAAPSKAPAGGICGASAQAHGVEPSAPPNNPSGHEHGVPAVCSGLQGPSGARDVDLEPDSWGAPLPSSCRMRASDPTSPRFSCSFVKWAQRWQPASLQPQSLSSERRGQPSSAATSLGTR